MKVIRVHAIALAEEARLWRLYTVNYREDFDVEVRSEMNVKILRQLLKMKENVLMEARG